MNKKSVALVLFVLFASSVVSGYSFLQVEEKNEVISDLEAKNSELRDQVEELEEEIASLNESLSIKEEEACELSNETMKLRDDLDFYEGRVSELEELVLEKNESIQELENQVINLEEFLEEKNESILVLENEVDSLTSLVREKNETIYELEERVSYLGSLVDEKNQTISVLRENNSLLLQELEETEEELETAKNQVVSLESEVSELEEIIQNDFVLDSLDYYVLAVYEDSGEGTVLDLETELVVGDSEINLDVQDTIYGEYHMQQSFRTAFKVSSDVVDSNFSNRSLDQRIYSRDNLLNIGGPSAGAGICLSQIAISLNKTVDTDILITGTIQSDRDIGQVGEVREKVEAAKEFGAEMVLVPDGQYVSVDGIEVREVRDIEEAGNYLYEEGF